jgi:hypothetical protein
MFEYYLPYNKFGSGFCWKFFILSESLTIYFEVGGYCFANYSIFLLISSSIRKF